MLDIGWSELLVVAIVLIVVVGPKDLPPMIRAFGKMTANLRKMAGEFRTQFDQALKDADMDDVRRTIGDVQNLNPTNALRDAINPLRQMGQDIKSDLQRASSLNSTPVTATEPVVPLADVRVPEPSVTLPQTPPQIDPAPVVPVTSVAEAPAVAVSEGATIQRPRKKAAAKTKPEAIAVDAPAKPVRKRAVKVEKPAVLPTATEAMATAEAPATGTVKKTATRKNSAKAVSTENDA